MDNCSLSRWEILKRELNNLTPESFRKAVLEKPAITLIDCRRAGEFSAGHLPGAINIDYLAYDFWDKISQLDANEPIYVYCQTGRRSVRTCTLMKNGGFDRVYNLDGGLNAYFAHLGEIRFSFS